MGDQTSRAKVSVALIGVGPTWELHYRDAVEHLSSRLSVRAVCDCVHVRATAVADEFQAAAVSSPWLLSQRRDLHAWLILDPSWLETYPADLAVQTGRNALYANPFSAPFPKLEELFRRSMESGETLMPEFPERFTSATVRLRELMATRLGPVQRIEIAIPMEAPSTLSCWLYKCPSNSVGILDWCSHLVGGAVTSPVVQTTDRQTLEIDFLPRVAGHSGVAKATIRVVPADGHSNSRRTIHCENGWAVLDGSAQIEWQTDGKTTKESLDNERSPYEIILDQFCRRSLGGLVPVPTLKDALHAIAAAQLVLSKLPK